MPMNVISKSAVKPSALGVVALLFAFIGQTAELGVHAQAAVNTSYSFSEATGGSAADGSGNENTATLSGATWTAAGRYGPAVSLDGVGDRLEVASAPTLDVTSAFTLEAWVNPTRKGLWQAVIFKEAPSGDGPYGLWMTPEGRLRAQLLPNGGPLRVVTGLTILRLNEWTHIAATYDGSSLRLWVNGVEDGVAAATGSAVTSTESLWLGSAANGYYFAGRLDEVRIYGQALSGAEVALDAATPVDPGAPLMVTLQAPRPGERGVMPNRTITATFSKPVDDTTVTSSTVMLRDGGGAVVAAQVSYDATSRRAIVQPDEALLEFNTYTVTVAGGTGAPRVLATSGGSLAADVVWEFQVAGALDWLRAAYGFSEGSGQATSDSTGYGNAGELIGADWTATGRYGLGVSLDGVDDQIQIPDSDTLDLTDAFTLEAWVSPSRTTTWQALIVKGAVSGDRPYSLSLTAEGRLHAELLPNGGSEAVVTGLSVLPVDEWTHVAATYDGTTLTLWMNGIEEASVAATGSALVTRGPLWLGGTATNNYFQGRLDDVRLYGRALNSSEILSDMTASAGLEATIVVNGLGPTGSLTMATGAPLTVEVYSGPGNPTNFVALAQTGQPDSEYLERQYLDGGSTPPAQGLTDATLTFTAPTQPGVYEFRLFGDVGGVRLARSTTINVQQVPTVECSYSMFPSQVEAPNGGGAGTVTASATWGCLAAPTTNAPWLTATIPPDYVATILADDPRAYWRLNETTDTVAADSSGHSFSAVYQGVSRGFPTPWSDGDRAARFDGGYVWLGYPSPLDPAGASFSLEAWTRFAQPTSGAIAGSYVQGYGYVLGLNGTRARFLAEADSTALFDVQSATHIDDDAWHHVVGVYDATSGEARIYVDGVLEASQPASNAPWAGGGFMIGASDFGGAGFVDAAIDDVAYYDAALASTQITSHFVARGSATSPANGIYDYFVSYTAQSNPTGVARAGSITVGNAFTTITQPSVPCTFSPTTPLGTVTAGGGSQSLAVFAVAGCSWTFSIDSPWISIDEVINGYRGPVLADGAAGYWRLDEVDTTTLSDSSGHGTAGTLFGTYTQGIPGAIADGNAATRFDWGGAEFAGGTPLNPGAFSVEAWIRVDTSDSGTIAGSQYWTLWIDGGRLRFRRGTGEINLFELESTRAINDNRWHHVVAVFDPAQYAARLFIDGVLDSSLVTAASLSAGPYSIWVGHLRATLDELAVYAKALTAAQVAQHFAHSQVATDGTGVIRYTVAENSSIQNRSAVITLAGIPVQIAQAGAPCLSVSPLTVNAQTAGGSGTVTVTALDPGCTWTASSSAPWVTVDPTNGSGSGVVTYTVEPNPSKLVRRATLSIAGHSVVLSQDPAPLTRPSLRYSASMGDQHVLALKNDGTVWAWGRNNTGKVGDGTITDRRLPVAVSTLTDIVAVAAGGAHSLALKSDGTVWSWGHNAQGQLGDGTTTERRTPIQVPGLSDVIAIAAGGFHSVALKGDGTVWTWGSNSLGQIGDGTQTNRANPTLVTSSYGPVAAVQAVDTATFVLTTEGTVWAFGRFWPSAQSATSSVAVQVTPTSMPFVEFGVGGAHGLGIRPNGTLGAWGLNGSGQLGDGTTISPPTPIELSSPSSIVDSDGGASHTLSRTTNGEVWSWGGNSKGQLGDGTTLDRSQPAPLSLADIVAASASAASSIAVSIDGRVWTWGDNEFGQLGTGTLLGSTTPQAISDASFTWSTPAPSFSPGGGTYSGTISVTLFSPVSAVTIHYTTNGIDPTETDPVIAAGIPISVSQSTTLKARSWSATKPPSPVVTGVYTLKVLTPTADPASTSYTSPQEITLSTVTPAATIHYTLDGTTPSGSSPIYVGPITIATTTTLKAIAVKPGWQDSEVLTHPYNMHFGTLPLPTFVQSSGTYLQGQIVEITATNGAVIRYTTDGSEPHFRSQVYTGPLPLLGAITIRAAAFHQDWTPSDDAAATYVVRANPVTLSPSGGTYASSQLITLTSATPGAEIHYTTNGIEPTTNDPAVASGGTIAVGNFALKARVFRANLLPGDLVEAEYHLEASSCTSVLSPQTLTVNSRARGGFVSVQTSDAACSWLVSSNVPWISVLGAEGTGNGRVAYRIQPNTSITPRSGVVSVGDQHFTIVQVGVADCAVTVNPPFVAAESAGAADALGVGTSDASCTWTASSNQTWAKLLQPGTPGPFAFAVTQDQPAGYWRLDEANGSTAALDASGNGRNGAYLGTPLLGLAGSLGDFSTAASFDGATAALEIPHHSSFDAGMASWELWVNVPATSTLARTILTKGGGNEMFALAIAPEATQLAVSWTTTGVGRQEATLPTAVVGAGWTHVAFTYDSSGWRAYLNGIEEATGAASGALALNNSPIVLGRGFGSSEWFNGQTDELAVYPYALSAEQIANHVTLGAGTGMGTAALPYEVQGNSTGNARQASILVGGTAVKINQSGGDAVVIGAATAPLPGPRGWHTSNVLVTFLCAGAGVISCPQPATITSDGAHSIAGQASNDLGQTATVAVPVWIDRKPPSVSITSPGVGAIVEPGTIRVRGAALDELSPVRVTCNGLPATASDGRFECQVFVPHGTTEIVVEAEDAAGNTATDRLPVASNDASPAPPSSLQITPDTVKMLAGERRRFRVSDNLGRTPSSAAWTLDNFNLATLMIGDGDVELTAVTAGEVDLTVTWRGLTATTTVNILPSGTVFESGETLWSVPAANGSVERLVRGTTMADGNYQTYALEHDGHNFKGPTNCEAYPGDLIRAFDIDNAQRWSLRLPCRVKQMAASPDGGVIAFVEEVDTSNVGRVTAYSPSGSGTVIATNAERGFAVDAEGRVWFISGNVLRGGSLTQALPAADEGGGWTSNGIPTVLDDGRVAVLQHVVNPGQTPDRLQLIRYVPGGEMTVTTVFQTTDESITPYRAVPNGRGDVLITWDTLASTVGSGVGSARIGVVRGNGQSATTGEIGDSWGGFGNYPEGYIIVAEDRVWAVNYNFCHDCLGLNNAPDPHNKVAITQLTLTGSPVIADFVGRVDQNTVPKLPTLFAVEGGFVISYPDGTVGGPSSADQFNLLQLSAANYDPSTEQWVGGNTGGGVAGKAGPAVKVAQTAWPMQGGGEQAPSAAWRERDENVLAIGWIDPNGVPLSTTGVDPIVLSHVPPQGLVGASFLQKAATLIWFVRLAAGDDRRPDMEPDNPFPVYLTAADKAYTLKWTFKFAANPCNEHRCPEMTSFKRDWETFDFAYNRDTSYKLFNKLRVVSRRSPTQVFKVLPPVARSMIGVTIDPIFATRVPGEAGPLNEKRQDLGGGRFVLINDGTPDFAAVAMFNTLTRPNKWNHIGSRIEVGRPDGPGYKVDTQVYPTYNIFHQLKRVEVRPQAPDPHENFSCVPYPQGPHALFVDGVRPAPCQ